MRAGGLRRWRGGRRRRRECFVLVPVESCGLVRGCVVLILIDGGAFGEAGWYWRISQLRFASLISSISNSAPSSTTTMRARRRKRGC